MLIKLFGVPGAGKTTTCVEMILHLVGVTKSERFDFLNDDNFNKYTLEDICFTTFTKAGIESIKQKMRDKGFEEREMPYFKTLNSITWSLAGFNGQNILKYPERNAFFKRHGIETYKRDSEYSEADEIEKFYDWLTTRTLNYVDTLVPSEIREFADYCEMHMGTKLKAVTLASVVIDYAHFLRQSGKNLHIDSLLKVSKNKFSIRKPVLIVDEAQDLNPLQHSIITNWEKDADIFVMAGDDDQAVHEWNGADVSYFLTYTGNRIENKVVLEKSYRLAHNVSNLCNDISHHINDRQLKTISGCARKSDIEYYDLSRFDAIAKLIEQQQEAGKKTYLLFRTNKIQQRIENLLFTQTNIIFRKIDGREDTSKYSLLFYIVSNALNKIQNNLPLHKNEVVALFSCMDAKECLVPGKYTQVQESSKMEYDVEEVLQMTRKWKKQKSLDYFFENKQSRLKNDIIEFVYFIRNTRSDAVKKINSELQKKLRQINYIFDREKNDEFLVQTGTYHKSKGLEADTVFVFLGTSGFFSEINDSEIRCLYTACSRPRDKLYFVGADVNEREADFLERFFEKIYQGFVKK